MFWIMYFLFCLIIAAGLGLIPAYIAKKKGYSFGLWWFYGWMLFIVAIIHVNLIPDKNGTQTPHEGPDCAIPSEPEVQLGAAAALKNYKELLDSGAITQEEFEAKKKQLLNL